MFTTAVIAIREYLEVFLIVGVFLGISKKLKLKREKEIIIASGIGVFFAFLLPLIVFFMGDKVRAILTEESAELLESYLMIFSGFFIAYVVFSLHNIFALKKSKLILNLHQKLQQNVFDVTLFLTIIFFILREGFEIALFTATTSLFFTFFENLVGLGLGLLISFCIGTLGFLAYIRFPIGKVFKITEYLIIFLGATFVKNGLTELVWQYAHISLSKSFPLPLMFLPPSSTLLGHILYNFVGLERGFSGAMLSIMFLYVVTIRVFFLNKKLKSQSV